MNYASLMEKKATEWANQPENIGPRPDKVDFEIEKLSKELHELTLREKEINIQRIGLLNRINTMKQSLNTLLVKFKAEDWIKDHPKPARKSPVKMSELQTILNAFTPEEREAFWTAAKDQKKSKRGGQSQ